MINGPGVLRFTAYLIFVKKWELEQACLLVPWETREVAEEEEGIFFLGRKLLGCCSFEKAFFQLLLSFQIGSQLHNCYL